MLVPFIFVTRRLISLFVVVFFRGQAMFQVFPLMIMSLMNLMYMLWSQRYKTFAQFRQEIINEATVYIMLICFLVFTNVVLDTTRKDNLGWLVIGLVATNVFQILASTAREQLYIIQEKAAAEKKVKDENSQMQIHIDNRTTIVS